MMFNCENRIFVNVALSRLLGLMLALTLTINATLRAHFDLNF